MPDTTLLLSFHATGDQDNPLEIQFREDLTPMQLSTLISASVSMLVQFQKQVEKDANLSRCCKCMAPMPKDKLRYWPGTADMRWVLLLERAESGCLAGTAGGNLIVEFSINL